ncbi:ImmA/IrrE family metallo-endopeptidase [Methylobacterium sp. CM6247]
MFPKGQVHSFAESVASRLGFDYSDPIEPLVSRLGGSVAFSNPQPALGGYPESIVIESSNNFTIYLPYVTSLVRDRFTIAHELGHLFLHYPMVLQKHPGSTMFATRWVDDNDTNLRRCEWEANWFAAGFLMPAEPFKEHYRQFNGDLRQIALQFLVSPKAAEVRAKSLCL